MNTCFICVLASAFAFGFLCLIFFVVLFIRNTCFLAGTTEEVKAKLKARAERFGMPLAK